MNIRIDAEKAVRPLHNFWNHIHFHPTDAIEDDWGRRILDQVAADHAAITVRMYTMMEDIVSMDADGRLHYDFTLNDTRIDYMLEKGFRLLLSYNFIPPCIAAKDDEVSVVAKNGTRYKGKFIVTAPPKDYKLWEEICYQYTKHIVERYGLDEVKNWFLGCFNEPDCTSFWMKDEKNLEVRAAEYCKLYDAFEAGLRRVDTGLCIGGPVVSGNMPFLELFLKHTSETGKQLSFLSFHTYGTNPFRINSGEKPICVQNTVPIVEETRRLAVKYGYEDTPLVIDEWGASSHGFYNIEECPVFLFRENEIYSAYYAKLIAKYVEMDLPIDRMMICLSGQHEMKVDFSGFRNFFTLNFYRKPIYNAYCLGAKLGDTLLPAEGKTGEELSILPTRSADGRISVMLAYASEHFDEALADLDVSLEIAGLNGTYRKVVSVIDRTRSNAIDRYYELGSPDTPNEEQIAQIRRAGEIVSEESVCRAGEKLNVTMTNNGTVLVELIPVA